MVIGPSTATVSKGTGRIEVGGARGSLVGSTDAGDLHVKAIPRDHWQLRSASGNVLLNLPPLARVELYASTDSGAFQFDRDDVARPEARLHHFHQKISGGSKQIEVRTRSGKIVIR
jgi:Putative adhesin